MDAGFTVRLAQVASCGRSAGRCSANCPAVLTAALYCAGRIRAGATAERNGIPGRTTVPSDPVCGFLARLGAAGHTTPHVRPYEGPDVCNLISSGLIVNRFWLKAASPIRIYPLPEGKGELSSLDVRLTLLPLSLWERGLGGEGRAPFEPAASRR